MQVLAKLARLDPASLPPVVELAPGQSGLDENLRHWIASMDWACGGRPTDLLRRANEWLWANRPRPEATGLSWGDARIGNMIFHNWRCVAAIDWETVTLAGPQLDLAHWLIMDEYSSHSFGVRRLPGLGTREETIELWEELTGMEADQLQWHEVLAGFRLTIIMARYAALWAEAGRHDIIDCSGETLMSRLLRRVLSRVAGI
jgi:aminoglycoside phosphotransferase (APT) family kinase protein